MTQQVGSQSIMFNQAPYILDMASVVGEKEGNGPIGDLFDYIEKDPMFGTESWEQAESALQKKTTDVLLAKTNLSKDKIRYMFSGDLLGQLIATSFNAVSMGVPLFGLYGACSTMGEALCLSAMCVAGGYADYTLAMASSHFASAEKEFRFPLEYGNQRPYSASWTVTGCGAAIVNNKSGIAKIEGATPGKIVDYGLKDSMNMGACMAPAAADTIYQNLKDFGRKPEDYDAIITGDLGEIGKTILIDLLKEKGVDISERHMDCGLKVYNNETQDTHAGGSGCGCSAVTLSAYILPKIKSGKWEKVLFVPTGALLSKVSFNEGESVPGIAHGVVIKAVEG